MNADNSDACSGDSSARDFPRVAIVGAGISGLCLAIRLKTSGIGSFTIFEKSQDVGGTWLDNSYPGCGCDVPSILYSYSFAPKHDWSRKYAPQAEILDYFRECADRFGIRQHIRFGQSVESAEFEEERGIWIVRTDSGDEFQADVFVSAAGQLNRPKIPEIEGISSFRGEAFHSARWNHDFQVDGRRVAVVGNGASAIQLIPKIAEKARRVYVFQRTPNWITRRHDYPYPKLVQQMFRWVPGAAKLHRLWIFLTYEWLILLYTKKARLNHGFTSWLRFWMRRDLPQHLQNSVIPRYPAGCKRVLLSNDYLQSLQRENVELITRSIVGISEDGILTEDGLTSVDAIVFATGFDSNQFLRPMQIHGREDAELHHQWKDRPRTHFGMMCPRFPNMFMLYGPNTNLGHNSIIFMVECQVRYILNCLSMLIKNGDQTLEIRAEEVEEFDRRLQAQLRRKVWSGYVTNWYTSPAGYVVNNWSGSTLSYWLQTRKSDRAQFIRTKRKPVAEHVATTP